MYTCIINNTGHNVFASCIKSHMRILKTRYTHEIRFAVTLLEILYPCLVQCDSSAYFSSYFRRYFSREFSRWRTGRGVLGGVRGKKNIMQTANNERTTTKSQVEKKKRGGPPAHNTASCFVYFSYKCDRRNRYKDKCMLRYVYTYAYIRMYQSVCMIYERILGPLL